MERRDVSPRGLQFPVGRNLFLWSYYVFSVNCFFVLLFSRSVVSDSLQPHEHQHARLPCPSLPPGVCSDSCPLSSWCHPTISSCFPLLFLPSISPSIRVFCSESALRIRWPKYWSFSFSISPSNEYLGLMISFRIDWFDGPVLAVQGTLKILLQHRNLKASVVWCLAFFMIYYFTYLPIFYIF